MAGWEKEIYSYYLFHLIAPAIVKSPST
jgi:hypothetical protein